MRTLLIFLFFSGTSSEISWAFFKIGFGLCVGSSVVDSADDEDRVDDFADSVEFWLASVT